jgi:hypothetical protein
MKMNAPMSASFERRWAKSRCDLALTAQRSLCDVKVFRRAKDSVVPQRRDCARRRVFRSATNTTLKATDCQPHFLHASQNLFVSFAPFCGYFFFRAAADYLHLQADRRASCVA